ncbi:MAG: bifunctional 2-polyprenyl-6-hydroxyphenol methylase/3-demethylubiquinol 3-O-methyltransferase UbiG [Hyphomicrobiaceae bacterium]|nr:bifunctional 2-polyprenyl-6-hydroxyphenol methylase/3-demethylubiquinol 3-O-methyltransferase UbiG [Hyphomicrobiaceae bacterium]
MSNPGTDPSGAAANVNVDPDEVARFAALAERWWDAHGAFKPLHQIGPARLAFIRDSIVEALGIPRSGLHPLKGMRLVDIGSGGGLVSEPLARLGATVTGIDLAAESVAAARAHAEAGGLSIDYRVQSIEELAASGERFDAAVCLEVVEHVPDPAAFIATAARVLEPGGILVVSTLSRTLKSYALAIIGAEHVLRWVPRGTHQWDRFLTPDELEKHFVAAGLVPIRTGGIVYQPSTGRWVNADDTDVNYMMAGRKPDAGTES